MKSHNTFFMKRTKKNGEMYVNYVIYGNAVWFFSVTYILTCIGALRYTMLIFRFISLCSLRWYIRRKCDNYVQIIYLYFDYMFLPFQYHIIYIITHLSDIVPKSNSPLLAYLIWCSSSPLGFFSFLALLTNLQLSCIYTALGGIAKYGEIPNKVMT